MSPGKSQLQPDWASRFLSQAESADELGSPLYGRLFRIIAEDIRSGGPSWEVMSSAADLSYGQAGPLRLVGGAHRLALDGAAPEWARYLPSCGGSVPSSDEDLRRIWIDLVHAHADALRVGLTHGVQTNEVARSAGLGLALASSGFEECALIELGCSGALNLRLDHFGLRFGDVLLGDADSEVQLEPELRGSLSDRSRGGAAGPPLTLPRITSRIGIDPHPIDVTTVDGQRTLSSFVWPDQSERFRRLEAAIRIASRVPAHLIQVSTGTESEGADSASALRSALQIRGARVVQQSIVWQYVATPQRWAICEVIEQAGRLASPTSPLAWIRYEPDEWNRARAAILLRTWPGGGDRLVAHTDFHGRWLSPIPVV